MQNIIPFQKTNIRKVWHKEQWYFFVIDIVGVLTGQVDFKKSKSYWTTLKNRLKNEGSQLVTKCDQLKMQSVDGKMYLTDVANTETLLRLIQSIPSPKAEPLKLWLAKVGNDRIAEIQNPVIGMDRAIQLWRKHGRTDKWIQQRVTGQISRNKLTEYWKEHHVKEGEEYALLTNIIHQEWAELDIGMHKSIKGLKPSHNLRDHMNEAELILMSLAEFSTRQIAESLEAEGLEENKIPAKKGGRIAKHARRELEMETGNNVVTEENFLPNKI